ncbi:bacterial alpha-L-rhamnosidase domain-containing protein [Bisporella sp. PMI_857]|nr:bacterial alpha-L-rhamnosidase domain-containing protein [Bisporella sp. PMI_857]
MATAVEVPGNQKVEKLLKTNLNEHFAFKAGSLIPTLQKWIKHPVSAIKFEPDHSSFFKCSSAQVHTIEELSSISYGKGDQFILEFGTHQVGYLSFYLGVDGVNVDAPARLRLTFGEIPYDVNEELHPCNTWISTSWLPDEVINVDWLPTKVEMPRRYSFRYVKIEIIDTSPKYKIRFQDVKVTAVSSVSPAIADAVPSLGINDEELQNIDRVSQLTLRNCMHTVFEDGPRRDRRLWLGDLRLQALTNYCTFKHYDLVKRCLYMFAALPREDGSLPACVFEKPKLAPASDYIIDYDALFGPTVYDYVVASKDLETGVELWPTILGSMRAALAHINPEGRFVSAASSAWKFLDWSEGLDTDAGMHGLVLFCCKQINNLAALLSKPPPFGDTVARMSVAVMQFYDESQKVFVSGPDKQISWSSQAWLALSDSINPEISLQAIKNAMSDPKAVKPLTPYAYHHVAEALARSGGELESLKLIRSYWGGMVRAGADTFWECFDEGDGRKSPYGDCHNNSYCHAWSCTPSYLLRVVLKEYLEVQQK